MFPSYLMRVELAIQYFPRRRRCSCEPWVLYHERSTITPLPFPDRFRSVVALEGHSLRTPIFSSSKDETLTLLEVLHLCMGHIFPAHSSLAAL